MQKQTLSFPVILFKKLNPIYLTPLITLHNQTKPNLSYPNLRKLLALTAAPKV